MLLLNAVYIFALLSIMSDCLKTNNRGLVSKNLLPFFMQGVDIVPKPKELYKV